MKTKEFWIARGYEIHRHHTHYGIFLRKPTFRRGILPRFTKKTDWDCLMHLKEHDFGQLTEETLKPGEKAKFRLTKCKKG